MRSNNELFSGSIQHKDNSTNSTSNFDDSFVNSTSKFCRNDPFMGCVDIKTECSNIWSSVYEWGVQAFYRDIWIKLSPSVSGHKFINFHGFGKFSHHI